MGPVLAITGAQGAILALVGVLVVAGGLALMFWRGQRGPAEVVDIPPAMQPGPSDEDLEKPRLEKLQAWGALLILFLVVWIPITWLREPTENLADEQALITDSIERGRRLTEPFSEENPSGLACERCHGEGLEGGQTLFMDEVYPVPRLTDVCGGPNTGHALITNLEDVRDTIMKGRPGTPMPSWSVRFAGSANDQQIQDIINYILSIQTVDFEQNVCINPKAPGYQAPA